MARRSRFWAEGYEGRIYWDMVEYSSTPVTYSRCRCAFCGKAIEKRLVMEKLATYCYHCGARLWPTFGESVKRRMKL